MHLHEVIVQTRVGGLPLISKHGEESKIRSRVFFNKLRGVLKSERSNEPVFCEEIMKTGLIYVISSFNFQTSSTVLIFLYLFYEILMSLRK